MLLCARIGVMGEFGGWVPSERPGKALRARQPGSKFLADFMSTPSTPPSAELSHERWASDVARARCCSPLCGPRTAEWVRRTAGHPQIRLKRPQGRRSLGEDSSRAQRSAWRSTSPPSSQVTLFVPRRDFSLPHGMGFTRDAAARGQVPAARPGGVIGTSETRWERP